VKTRLVHRRQHSGDVVVVLAVMPIEILSKKITSH
jgi:hypothetical protein